MGNLVGFVFLWIVLIVSTLGTGLLLLPVYWALVFRNSESRVAKATEKLRSTLMEDEQLRASAIQMRLSSLPAAGHP